MLESSLTVILIILVVNAIYVSLSTIRLILTMKSRRYLAALVSLLEVTAYVVALGLVLENLNDIQNVIAYAVGFALGVIIGSIIEEKLALGYITVNVVSMNPELNFSEQLRAKGYGVTSWRAGGRDGNRLAMQILTPRKYELNLYETIKSIDERAFIISYEPKHIYGGFWVRQVRRGRLFNPRFRPKEKHKQEVFSSGEAEPVTGASVDKDLMRHTLHEEEIDRALYSEEMDDIEDTEKSKDEI